MPVRDGTAQLRNQRLTAGTDYSRAIGHCYGVVFHVGLSDLPERHPRPASEVDIRPELRTSDADSVSVLFSLFCVLGAVVEVVNTIGYQRTMVAGLLTMAVGAFLFIPAAALVSFRFISDRPHGSGGGNHGSAGGCESLRGGVGKTRNGVEPAGFDTGIQLAGHHSRAENWWAADSERCAAGDGTAATSPPQALQAYRVQQAASVKAAISGDRSRAADCWPL